VNLRSRALSGSRTCDFLIATHCETTSFVVRMVRVETNGQRILTKSHNAILLPVAMGMEWIRPTLTPYAVSKYQPLSRAAHQTVYCWQPCNAFPVAAAQVWNGLPEAVVSSSSLQSFRRQLTTYLFQLLYAHLIFDRLTGIAKIYVYLLLIRGSLGPHESAPNGISIGSPVLRSSPVCSA